MFVPFGETFMSIPDTSKLISEIVRGNSKNQEVLYQNSF